MIPYSRQNIDEDDISAVVAVLQSDFITQGPVVPQFENAICELVGAHYGVACNSGTSALHIACLALGLGISDEVWTTPNSFVASANCALLCGAQVDFVDIDPLSFNISSSELKAKLEWRRSSGGRLPKAIVVVHFAGHSADMKEISRLAREFGFSIIEDASHALGAKYYDSHVGNCEYSDVTVFSFHPVKMITTGEGGLAVTNDPELASRMRKLSSHGITKNSSEFKQSSEPWWYEQHDLGLNYRMSDVQASLGLSQLLKLDHYLEARNTVVDFYRETLSDTPIRFQSISEDIRNSYHLCVILLEIESLQRSRSDIFKELKESGVGVNVHYIPIYKQPYFKNLRRYPDLPNTEHYYERTLSIPVYPGLQDFEREYVVQQLKKIFR